MKKLGIAAAIIATLTFGYLYMCSCCPETCCETSTQCQVGDKAVVATPEFK